MNKNPFLIAPPAASGHETSSEADAPRSDSSSRRRFLQRTGGATVASMVAWNMATQIASAQQNETSSSYRLQRSGESPIQASPPIRKTTEGNAWSSGGSEYRLVLKTDYYHSPSNTGKATAFSGQVKGKSGIDLEKKVNGVWQQNFEYDTNREGKVDGSFSMQNVFVQKGILSGIAASAVNDTTVNNLGAMSYSSDSTAGEFTSSKDLRLKVTLTVDANGDRPAQVLTTTGTLTISVVPAD